MMIEVALVLFSTLSAASSCESLKSLSLPGTTITAAPPGAGGPPLAGGRGQATAAPPPAMMLPAHCRVAAVLEPASDSHIEMEVWLPAENWNGKLEVVGNGGWAGTISFTAMASALREGYATAWRGGLEWIRVGK